MAIKGLPGWKWHYPVGKPRYATDKAGHHYTVREVQTKQHGGVPYEERVPPEQRKKYKPRKPKVPLIKKQKAIRVGSFPHAYNRHVPPLDLTAVSDAVHKIRGQVIVIVLWGIFEYDDTIEPEGWKQAKPRAKSAKYDKRTLINILTMAITAKLSAVDIAPNIIQLDPGERAYWIVGAVIGPSRFVPPMEEEK